MMKSRAWTIVILLAFAALTTSCGNGSGGLSISGDDQQPDPVVVDYPIIYIKRSIPVDATTGNPTEFDEQEPTEFYPGAVLYIRPRAAISAVEMNITAREYGSSGLYDVKDLNVSYDGTKVLFSMRAPEIPMAAPEDQPTWNIWEYDVENDTLRRVITSDIAAEDGQDISPAYLPDGRIIFSSTRQRQTRATLIDEGKAPYSGLEEDLQVEAALLHVMNADGTNIRQVSFNQSHDLYPTVTANGKVVFTRWENFGSNAMSLYRMNPDGSSLELLYGHHSHDNSPYNDVQFLKAKPLPNGRLLAQIRPFETEQLGGDYAIINTSRYIDYSQGTYANSSGTGPAEQAYTGLDIVIEQSISPGGRISALFPLWDGTNRALMAWSPCRLQEGSSIVPCTPARLSGSPTEAPPLYSLWMYNLDSDTQVPLVLPQENVVYSDIVVAQDRPLPNIIFDLEDMNAGDPVFDDLVTRGLAVLHIRSVYDFDGNESLNGTTPIDIETVRNPLSVAADQRPAQFIRIVKGVPIPSRDVRDFNRGEAFGPSGQQMKEIVGYVPVEPDGSAKFLIPADVPIALSVLDGNGRRISARHRNWMQFRPGEQIECNGCHTRTSTLPHGRYDAAFPSANNGAPTSGIAFPNTDPTLWVSNLGDSMAETWENRNTLRTPVVDVIFNDDWTDPMIGISAAYSFLYTDLTTASPLNSNCSSGWNAYCRIIINYPDHIQPLWELSRTGLDGMGNPYDHTCITCHSNRDAMMNVRVPEGQLDLHGGTPPGALSPMVAYDDLVRTSPRQSIIGGALLDAVQSVDGMGNPLFQTDGMGNLILDGMGNPIPVLETQNIASRINTAGANAARSVDFFAKFATGGSHEGYLTPAELRLIAEWVDIGGQYYNNPFDAPIN